MRLDILVCADHGFVMPCGVTLESLCSNNAGNEVHVHLITDASLTAEDISQLEEVILRHNPNNSLRIYRMNESLLASWDWYNDGYYPVQVFYRLVCAELLPPDIDRILYLDCDTIVRHPLYALWKVDLGDHPVGVVVDASEVGRRLGFGSDDVYFNSGVMLINLKYWREHNCSKALFDYIEAHRDQIRLPDQDPLNIIFKDNKKLLDLSYNLQPIAIYKDKYVTFPWRKYPEFRKAQRDPAIIHYAGARPWEKGIKHPYLSEWFKYRQQTRWKDTPQSPSRVKLATHLKNGLRMLLTPFGICHYVRDYYNRDLRLE